MTDIVDMWYDERGAGDPVVLLHGGMTDSRCFAGNLDGPDIARELYISLFGFTCPTGAGTDARRTRPARSLSS